MVVQAITDPKDVKSIKKLLANNPRDLLIFTMGINTGLRAGDLLNLKIYQVENVKVGDRVSFIEQKTEKQNVFIINNEIKKCLDNYLATRENYDPNDYLFKSRKYRNSPLSVHALGNYIKNWCSIINLKGNFSSHTLRKTWAYMQRVVFKVSWSIISKRLNHSNPAITLRYLCIQDEEVEKVLLNNV